MENAKVFNFKSSDTISEAINAFTEKNIGVAKPFLWKERCVLDY